MAVLQSTLRVHPADDVIVALQPLKAGQTVPFNGESWTLREDIGAKHKFAARDFAVGDKVTMYGVTVGRTTQPVAAGALLHTHNLKHATDGFGGKERAFQWTAPDASAWRNRTFRGFKRPQGPAGTANYWIVIPLVFCENRNLAFLREALQTELGYRKTGPYQDFVRRMVTEKKQGAASDVIEALDFEITQSAKPMPLFPHVDGVKFLEHGMGCGGTRQDADALCGLLAGYINHPNVAGATVLSLGCQNAQISILERELAKRNPQFSKPLHIFEQQKSASERDMMGRALKATFLGIAQANELKREPSPALQRSHHGRGSLPRSERRAMGSPASPRIP